MHVVYIDEVQNDPMSQPYFWLGALAITEKDLFSVENALNGIARAFYGSELLTRDTEFHATQIMQGKGNFKGRGLDERINLLCQLTTVISDQPDVARIQVRLDPSRMSRDDHARIAFMFLVEKVDQYMASLRDTALLIADNDKEFANANVRSLATYRVQGTEFAYGRDITHVADTVHHTDSRHSRLLQLADVYVYSCALVEMPDLQGHRRVVSDHIRALPNFCWPTKYKRWPPE
jgi:hypothetical protein